MLHKINMKNLTKNDTKEKDNSLTLPTRSYGSIRLFSHYCIHGIFQKRIKKSLSL